MLKLLLIKCSLIWVGFIAFQAHCQPNLMMRYGSEGRNEVRANALYNDNYILAGNIPADGLQDIFVMMVDSVGNVQWSNQYSVSTNEFVSSVLVKDSIIFVTGRGASNMGFLLKIAENGDLINAFRYFYVPGFMFSRAILLDDHIYVVGNAMTDGNWDLILSKIDLNGTLVWSKQYLREEGGESVWDIEASSDGGFLITGNASDVGDYGDIYLMKTDAEGSHLWTRHYGVPALNTVYDIVETSDNHILMSSRIKEGAHFHNGVFKLNAMGDTVWTRIYGDLAYGAQSAPKIMELSDGNYLIKTSVVIMSEEYPVYIKIDQNGGILWERYYGFEADYNSHELMIETYDGGFFTSASFFNDGYEDFGFIKTDSMGLGICTADLAEMSVFSTGLVPGTLTFGDTAFTLAGTPSPNQIEVEVSSHMICCDSVDAEFTYEVVDGAYTFTATDPTADEFLWVIGSDTLMGPIVSYSFLNGGLTEICLHVSNFCNSDSSCTEIQPGVSTIANFEDELSVSAYPNPFTDQFIIQLNEEGTPFSFKIYDQTGTLIHYEPTIFERFTFESGKLAKGLYLLEVEIGKGEVVYLKIIKT